MLIKLYNIQTICPHGFFKQKWSHEIKFAIKLAAPRNLIIITP